MKQHSKKQSRSAASSAASKKPERTVGLDLGDRYSHSCILTREG